MKCQILLSGKNKIFFFFFKMMSAENFTWNAKRCKRFTINRNG